MKRRGNPNWGNPESGGVVPIVTEFEKTVDEYNLTLDQYLQSSQLSDALFNPLASSLFREPSRQGLLDYGSGRARAGFGATRGGRKNTELKKGPSEWATRPVWPKRNIRRGHPATGAPASTGVLREYIPEFYMSDAISSLPDRIAQYDHALTAAELAELLAVSRITVFKLAKAGRIPSFRIGTCVRFDPKAVANWLRRM
jgi:excisionase family DNA binding protein